MNEGLTVGVVLATLGLIWAVVDAVTRGGSRKEFDWSADRFEFRPAFWILILGILCTVGGVTLFVGLWFSVSDARWPVLIFFAVVCQALFAPGVGTIFTYYRSRVLIDGNTLTLKGMIRSKTLDLRTVDLAYATNGFLAAKQKEGRVFVIQNIFQDSGALLTILQGTHRKTF